MESYELVLNRRGGTNLWYGGHVYRKKVVYHNTINWVCLRGTCSGRATTRQDGSIKLGKTPHNHSKKFSVLDLKYDQKTEDEDNE